jgi:hypothetical protein
MFSTIDTVYFLPPSLPPRPTRCCQRIAPRRSGSIPRDEWRPIAFAIGIELLALIGPIGMMAAVSSPRTRWKRSPRHLTVRFTRRSRIAFGPHRHLREIVRVRKMTGASRYAVWQPVCPAPGPVSILFVTSPLRRGEPCQSRSPCRLEIDYDRGGHGQACCRATRPHCRYI